MKSRFVTFHTMTRASGKPAYVVNCAKALADRNANVLILDGLMYEQGAIAYQLFEVLGFSPVLERGKNLYDLIRDYETLCGTKGVPPLQDGGPVLGGLRFSGTTPFRGRAYPDVCGRAIPLPGRSGISYLPGNDGRVVEVRERIDFNDLFEHRAGYQLFEYIKESLAQQFDFVLLNAPAGHQEISGILCGQIGDLILAIDLDSPTIEANPSFEACTQLAQTIFEENGRKVEVKSVKGQALRDVVDMILGKKDIQ